MLKTLFEGLFVNYFYLKGRFTSQMKCMYSSSGLLCFILFYPSSVSCSFGDISCRSTCPLLNIMGRDGDFLVLFKSKNKNSAVMSLSTYPDAVAQKKKNRKTTKLAVSSLSLELFSP